MSTELLGLDPRSHRFHSQEKDQSVNEMMADLDLISQHIATNGRDNVYTTNTSDSPSLRRLEIERNIASPHQRCPALNKDHSQIEMPGATTTATPMERWLSELSHDRPWHELAHIHEYTNAGIGTACNDRTIEDERGSIVRQRRNTFDQKEQQKPDVGR